jgi:hypothetical protein
MIEKQYTKIHIRTKKQRIKQAHSTCLRAVNKLYNNQIFSIEILQTKTFNLTPHKLNKPKYGRNQLLPRSIRFHHRHPRCIGSNTSQPGAGYNGEQNPKQNFKIFQNQTGFSSTTYPGVCVAPRGFEDEIHPTGQPTELKTSRRPEPKSECRTVTPKITRKAGVALTPSFHYTE